MKNETVMPSLRTFFGYIWPALIYLVASIIILGGFVVMPDTAASERLLNSVTPVGGSSEFGETSKHKIDTSKPWLYTFSSLESETLDSSIWSIENDATTSTYNNELQTYTNRSKNIRIENDSLLLEAHKEEYDNHSYTSARINTKNTFAFTYGTLEVEMKLPRGIGTWPAAWLMPNEERYTSSNYPDMADDKCFWALNGEIDFMEAVGYLPGEIIPAAHSYNSLAGATLYTPGFVENPYDTYHRYGVVKTHDSILFTIDGRPYASREKTNNNPLDWPFNQSYYLILNLAIGGKWAGEQGVDESTAPWQMNIRSISYHPL